MNFLANTPPCHFRAFLSFPRIFVIPAQAGIQSVGWASAHAVCHHRTLALETALITVAYQIAAM